MERQIPVTSVARTLLDHASLLRLESLEKRIERAEELKLFDLRAVDELLARLTAAVPPSSATACARRTCCWPGSG